MFSDKLVKNDNASITALELYHSDYELVLKQLVTIYGDRHSIFYWNNGYECLAKLNLEPGKLKYVPTENHIDQNPLISLQQKKLPDEKDALFIFDNLLDFDYLTPKQRSQRESQIFNCANHLQYQPKVKLILLGEWIQLSPKLRLKIEQVKLSLPTEREIEQFLKTQLKQESPAQLISACQGLSWGDIHHELEQFQQSHLTAEENVSDSLNRLTQKLDQLLS